MVEPPHTFAFIIHPINPKADVARKWPWLGRLLSERQIDFFSHFFPPVYISEITGVRSEATGVEARGWFIAAPYTPRRMLELPVDAVYKKIIACGRMAERFGARILGLGAFTSVVGDAGVTIARVLDVPVTTGDSYTVHIAVASIREAARVMGISLEGATAAVIGATGSIGAACAELLAREVPDLLLIGRRPEALEAVRARCEGRRARLRTSLEVNDIREADLILTVSSAIGPLINPAQLRPGAVVCDVARPRDVAASVAQARDDVFVYDGGIVEVPGPVDFHFDFGFPPGMAYACMAETMALALEGRFEDYTLGKTIQVEQVDEIAGIAARHGFRLNGFRSFERDVTDAQIARVRECAAQKRRSSSGR
ncbi:MAG: shikimate dehydrogenase [Anaerolineae bacterium]|nr:shikimate dehydrogenase [Anaerolineae bacterium]